MRRLALYLASALVPAGLGCGGDDTPPPATVLDAGTRPDTGGGGVPALEVTVEIADGLGSDALLGDPLDLVLGPSGRPAVVYGAVPVGESRRVIRYAERFDADDWRVEDVVTPGAQEDRQGELLAISAGAWDGTVHVAYLGGDGDGMVNTPFATDLALASRGSGGWTERILVDTSGEAFGVCPDIQNYCNSGNVVGSHANVAVGPNGRWAVVYRDTHFSFGSDDLARADTEIYRSPGGPVLVDAERGGGAWSALTYLPSGALASAYLVESDFAGQDVRGIWVAIEDGADFTRVKVTDATTTHRLGLAADAEGTLWLTWFDVSAQDLVVARASAPYEAWVIERVDEAGSTGLYPDVELSPTGTPYVVYGYCGAVGNRDCPGNPGSSAEVRLARRIGGTWRIDPVDDGEGRGGVGFFNRLLFLPDGRMAVAYQDVRNLDVVVAIVEED